MKRTPDTHKRQQSEEECVRALWRESVTAGSNRSGSKGACVCVLFCSIIGCLQVAVSIPMIDVESHPDPINSDTFLHRKHNTICDVISSPKL